MERSTPASQEQQSEAAEKTISQKLNSQGEREKKKEKRKKKENVQSQTGYFWGLGSIWSKNSRDSR